MRLLPPTLALLMLAAPAAAQPGMAAPRPDPAVEITQRLADPATADKLANMMQSLAKAVLALRVGEIAAASEGRVATPADKRMTVRDLGRRGDPNFDRKLDQRLAQTRPMVEQSMKVLSDTLPTVMRSFKQAGDAIERAAANMPDPTYPRR